MIRIIAENKSKEPGPRTGRRNHEFIGMLAL